jgi:methionyl-tRNA formyltransferase
MDAGLDTGPVLLTSVIDIEAQDTTGSLHDRLAALGGRCIVDALARLDSLPAVVQPEAGVTYANKVAKADAQLDWNEPAATLARKLRAFNPFPGATAMLGGDPVKLWCGEAVTGQGEPGRVLAADANGIVVACGEGALRLTELQKPGGRRLASADFLRGTPLKAG